MNYSIQFQGLINDAKWAHYLWLVTINGELFQFKTGIGHAKPKFTLDGKINAKPKQECINHGNTWVLVPTKDDVLECLFNDAECSTVNFNEFCDNFGYSNDSLAAFDTYRACMDSATKLRKALGVKYTEEFNRINQLREAV